MDIPQLRRRRRPARSCLPCRRRKIKCDRSEPCGQCVTGIQQCVFRVYNDASPQDTSSSSIPQESPNSSHANLSPSSVDNRLVSISEPATEKAVITNLQPLLQDILRRVTTLESRQNSADSQSLSNPNEFNGSKDRQNAQTAPRDEIIIEESGMTRIPLGIAPEFNSILACYGAITGNMGFVQETSSERNPTFDDADTRQAIERATFAFHQYQSLAKSLKQQRETYVNLPSDMLVPNREVADRMVNLYFECFESTHRILHKPSFWVDYSEFWTSQQSSKQLVRLKVLLVVAIGSSVSQESDIANGLQNMIHQWVHSARTWLSVSMKRDQLSVEGIQIHCLTLLTQQIYSIGSDLIWPSVGALVHKAMQIGLHRDPKHLPPISILQAEIHRRLWSTIIELLLQSSLDVGMPPRISVGEFDCEPPSNINDEEIDKATTTLKVHPEHIYTNTSLQILLRNSFPIRLCILSFVTSVSSATPYSQALTLSAELTTACKKLEKYTKSNQKFGLSPFHRNLANYLVRNFLFVIHVPFGTAAQSNPQFYFSVKVNIDTVMKIIRPNSDDTFQRFMEQGSGMFKSGIKAASLVLGLELILNTDASEADSSARRNTGYSSDVLQALHEIKALTEEHIRQGATDIKSPLLISMMLARGTAGANASNLKRTIVEAAMDSIEYCNGLMRTRLDNQILYGGGSEEPLHELGKEYVIFDEEELDFDLFGWTGTGF